MIKALTSQDLDSFVNIRMDSLRLHPEAFGAAYKDGVNREQTSKDLAEKHEENFILGYFDHDKLIGIVGFVREEKMKKRHRGWIWGMFVYPEYRGVGIGCQLLKKCVEEAMKINGLEHIDLSVTHQAANALKLYEQMGFEIWGVDNKAFKIRENYLDEIHMKKMLYQTQKEQVLSS